MADMTVLFLRLSLKNHYIYNYNTKTLKQAKKQ